MLRTFAIHAFLILALTADAGAASLERIEFDSASQQLVSGHLLPGDRIQGYLAKPGGAGPFPAVVGLHGCAGMHDTTKQKLADDLVARGYVLLLVDSYATRGIKHACTTTAFATFSLRRQDAYGALVFLGQQAFVDPQRIAAVGFSAGAWLTLWATEPRAFEQFIPPSALRFRAAVAFYPPCQMAVARPEIPTLILIGALDDWTWAASCSSRLETWGNEGPPVELVVYPGAYHGFYYPHLQPGVNMFGHQIEYNATAADDSSRRLHEFLDRHLK